MAHRLTANACRKLQHSGRTKGGERTTDGYGLALSVKPTGAKNWVQRLVVQGKRRTLGLGSFPLVSLAEARTLAIQNQKVARSGGDPRARRETPDFRTASEKVIALRSAAWKNAGRSRAIWESSLEKYAFPVFGTKRVDKIDSADILRALSPIWHDKRETASRVRQRIHIILLWAVGQGFREYSPAGDAVLQALPRGTGRPQKHHKSIHYSEVGDAIRRIRESHAWLPTKLAFEFLVLTAARSGEVRHATWDEVDFEKKVWVVPGDRMKAGIEHRVPLSARAIEILEEARAMSDPHTPLLPHLAGCRLVFPSIRSGGPLSDMTLSKLVKENVPGEPVPHGFRSSFRTFAEECTNTPHAVKEKALAHVIPSSVERAYVRTDLFDKRKTLLDRWAAYVLQESGEVVSIATA